jgi:hypothetical protein
MCLTAMSDAWLEVGCGGNSVAWDVGQARSVVSLPQPGEGCCVLRWTTVTLRMTTEEDRDTSR